MRERRWTATGALLCVLCVLGGCGGGGDDPGTPRVLDFTVLETSWFGSIRKPRLVTVRSDAEWRSLWAEYASGFRAAPVVNFQSQMVVGVFVGEVAVCGAVEIRRVVQEGGTIRVEYSTALPAAVASGTAGCLAAVTYPVALATIARSDLPVSFLNIP